VPAAWDETRVLSGVPGQSLVIARRAGEVWYVGGINGREAAESAHVAFDFLGHAPSSQWSLTLIRDGGTEREFDSSSRTTASTGSVDVPMLPRGGFVMRLTR